MANEDLDLDVEKEGKKGGKLIIIILIVVVLGLGGAVGFLMIGGDDKEADEEGEPKKDEAHVTQSDAIYLALKPTFIVNFADSAKAAYLQTDINVMAVNQSVLDQVQEKMPVIRNDILFILGAESYESISDAAGKEKLREKVLAAINAVLASGGHSEGKAEGDDHGAESKNDSHPPEEHPSGDGHEAVTYSDDQVKQVYFTSFIMQ